LLTAWFDGANILYKESPNAMAFKTTGTANVYGARLAIYPNPVADKMHIQGVQDSEYRISDITGKNVLRGALPSNGTIEVGRLQPGLYLLNVTNGRETSQTTVMQRRPSERTRSRVAAARSSSCRALIATSAPSCASRSAIA
jgi:hypothetical protein